MALADCTARLSHLGPARIDASVGSGTRAYAPTRNTASTTKRLRLSFAKHTQQYAKLLHESPRCNRRVFCTVMSRPRVLFRNCRMAERCHRILFADSLLSLGTAYGGEFGIGDKNTELLFGAATGGDCAHI